MMCSYWTESFLSAVTLNQMIWENPLRERLRCLSISISSSSLESCGRSACDLESSFSFALRRSIKRCRMRRAAAWTSGPFIETSSVARSFARNDGFTSVLFLPHTAHSPCRDKTQGMSRGTMAHLRSTFLGLVHLYEYGASWDEGSLFEGERVDHPGVRR